MSKIIYANNNGIKHEANVPDAIAQSDLKNGYLVLLGIDENGKHAATLPACADDCKMELRFVWNTIEKPELLSENDYFVAKGAPARLFRFMHDCPVYVSPDLVSGTVAIGKKLIPDEANFGKLKESATVDGYKVILQVTDVLTKVNGKLYLCELVDA